MSNGNPNYYDNSGPALSFDFSLDDLVEGVGDLGDSIKSWVAPSYELLQGDKNVSWGGSTAEDKPVDIGAKSKDDDKETGFFGKANSWLNNNKGLANIGGAMLVGMAQSHMQGEQQKSQAEARMAELRARDQMDQEANARYSASISGLRKPGIIGKQMALKRTNGTSIFNNGKLAGG